MLLNVAIEQKIFGASVIRIIEFLHIASYTLIVNYYVTMIVYSRLTRSLEPVRSINGCPFSRLHVIFGSGFPVAWHDSVAFSPSINVRSGLDSSVIMSGGTTKQNPILITTLIPIRFLRWPRDAIQMHPERVSQASSGPTKLLSIKVFFFAVSVDACVCPCYRSLVNNEKGVTSLC